MLGDICGYPNDDFFINPKFNKNIDVFFPSTDLEVVFKFKNSSSTKKKCSLVAEKLEYQGLIQIRLFEKQDRTKMFFSTIDAQYFEHLRQDQSLHVTFTGFVENVSRILKDCKLGKMDINVVEERGNISLQFYEHRKFKNLIHLSLPLREAPLPLVCFYINSLLDDVTKENCAKQNQIMRLQSLLDRNNEELNKISSENARLNVEVLERERKATSKQKQEIECLHSKINGLLEERTLDEARYKDSVASLKYQLEQMKTKHAKAMDGKLQDLKAADSLKEEISCLKAHTAILKEQNDKLQCEIAAKKNLERKNEMHLKDSKQTIFELQEKLRKFEKVQSELNAELEAERKITAIKRNALQIATEEIEKANDIISKQGKELVSLRNLLEIRTEVALNQEKAVREKEMEITIQKQQLDELRLAVVRFQKLSENFPDQLHTMKGTVDQLEEKYSQRISDLNSQLYLIKDGVRNITK